MIENTVLMIKENECTGCGACFNKCPVPAIQMVENSEGFLFPHINESTCIHCGQCLAVCPVHKVEYQNLNEPECYAACANDDIRMDSSSGGIFTLAAQYILDQNGYVCGAAYTDNFEKVEHILISDESELSCLRGSKYVQSDMGQNYRKIQEILKDGKLVLFTGCPCQVAGLYKFLGHEYDNLFTIDLVCHGVPSPKVFRRFVQQRKKEYGPIKYLSFRDKRAYGWTVSTLINFDNGETYKKYRTDSSYMKSFLELMSLRKSCGNCPFAHIPRMGDLTIADFWNIDKYNKEYDDKKGTSMVLINNERGRHLFDLIRWKMILCEKVPLDFAKKNNAQLYASSKLHPRRKRFFSILDLYDIDKAIDYGINRRFDIGYVGWWYGLNYGSALTNYALHETLAEMGKTVLMLEWPTWEKATWPIPDSHTRRFARRHYDISMRQTYDNLDHFNYHCESFILGSDQLWNYYSVKENGNYFFLDFVHPGKRKIAYATSFGHSTSFFPKERQLEISEYLQQFTAISVREKDGVDICRDTFGVHAVQTLDPVFICSPSAYEKAINDAEASEKEPYILGYILNPTEEKRNALLRASRKLQLPLKVILDGQENYDKNYKAMNLNDAVLGTVGVEDWLYYFENAQFILTDSYHGLCFSLIFHKNFICFGNRLRGMSRFNTLIEITKLDDHMLLNPQDDSIDDLLYRVIDYNAVEQRLDVEKRRSREWLKNALEMPLPTTPPLTNTMITKLSSLEKRFAQLEEKIKRLLG